MRLLLIVLLYLFTPLYFAALQAGASLSSSQQAGLFSIVANNASNISSTADTPLYSFLSTDNLKQVLNFSVDAIKKVGKVAAEFIDHPVSQITETGAKILRDLFSGYYSHMNQATQVYPADKPVSIVTEIGSGMHTFHLQRSYHVRDALNQYFGISTTASSVPKIALTVSGGGMRACLCTAGFLAGAEQTGLLDCVMYNAAISGGSWAVGSASYLFAKTNPRITFTQFKNNIVKHLNKGIAAPGTTNYLPPFIEHPASDGMARNLFRRVAWDQPITSMELYGALIANVTLQGLDGWDQSRDGKRFDAKLSDVAVACQQGILPLPLLATAVPINAAEEGNPHGYKWMAFSPLRAGTKDIGGYLPMWAMGRSYVEGQNDLTYKGFAAEYSLSYLLGACGSAYAVNLKYFFGNENPLLEVQGFKIPVPIHIGDISDLRLYPYKIRNFTQDIPQAPLAGQEFMKMVDGALCFNIPLPLVAKPEDTAADIIIMVDSDSDAVSSKETSGTLATINRYFKEINPGVMPVLDPKISINLYRNNKVFNIFNDPRDKAYNPEQPVVVYFPLIRNKKYSQTFDPAGFSPSLHPEVDKIYNGPNYLATFNFKYTQAQAQELADLMEYNIKQSIPEIKNMLQAYMQYRQKNQNKIIDPKYKDQNQDQGIILNLGV